MIKTHQNLNCISTEDYYYLTENFEFVDARTRADQVCYLVYSKDRKIIDTFRKVMENELTERERNMAMDYWSNNLAVNNISKKYNISRSAFYREIKEIKQKIDTYLKYVLFYNDIIKPPSVAEFIMQVQSNKFMGEQVEN